MPAWLKNTENTALLSRVGHARAVHWNDLQDFVHILTFRGFCGYRFKFSPWQSFSFLCRLKAARSNFSFLLWMEETDRLQKAPVSHIIFLLCCGQANIPLLLGNLAAPVQLQVLRWQLRIAGRCLYPLRWTSPTPAGLMCGGSALAVCIFLHILPA